LFALGEELSDTRRREVGVKREGQEGRSRGKVEKSRSGGQGRVREGKVERVKVEDSQYLKFK
jgi:hypothetical protein